MGMLTSTTTSFWFLSEKQPAKTRKRRLQRLPTFLAVLTRSPPLQRRLRNQRKVPVAQTRRSKHQQTVSQRLNPSQKSRSRAKANTLPRAKKKSLSICQKQSKSHQRKRQGKGRWISVSVTLTLSRAWPGRSTPALPKSHQRAANPLLWITFSWGSATILIMRSRQRRRPSQTHRRMKLFLQRNKRLLLSTRSSN